MSYKESNVFVEGIQVTSEHIGKKFKIVKQAGHCGHHPVGFEFELLSLDRDADWIYFDYKGDERCASDNRFCEGKVELVWVDRSMVEPKKHVSEAVRKKRAAEAHSAYSAMIKAQKKLDQLTEAYDKARASCVDAHMVVEEKAKEDEDDGFYLNISYQPPVKMYN